VSERSAKGILVAAVLWIAIVASVGALYKFLVRPLLQKETEEATSSESHYRTEITIAVDSFSGYSILRSEEIRDLLQSDGIRLTIQDDGADTDGRIRALRDGEVQMAAFTVDSLVASSARLGEFPATIVMVIDESKGADAVVAYKDAVARIEDLDAANAAFVLTPNSPSEFLARVTIANFNLPNLPEDWWIESDGAAEVYKRFKSANRGEKRAYVLWEPHVSRCLAVDGAHVLLDSSNLRGLIVDVLVAQRSFLKSHPDLVTKTVEAYLRAAYVYSREEGGLENLFIEDAKKTGMDSLSADQAKKLKETIQLKNTLENYAHFGLLANGESKGLAHIEDVVLSISRVLVRTGALESDPLGGKPEVLFYDGTLKKMKDGQFHPASLGLVQGAGAGSEELEAVRGEKKLKRLSDDEWKRLVSIGSLSADPIRFARGTARINLQSQRDLDDLAKPLESLPRYYLRVVGHTRAEGDLEANRKLAQERADATAKYLVEKGIAPDRIRAEAAQAEGSGGDAQSVAFVLGQLPY
jgi:outer membrane protein OmpA-like peptidoglycan-associated protein/ABC-type nitrate/sulfonate/bicarbonate transport system substrate-binding protein